MNEKVIFVYDPNAQKWDVVIEGVTDPVEAVQMFNAILITCSMAEPSLVNHKAEKQEDGSFKIIVGI
jgi:hypothetical protein